MNSILVIDDNELVSKLLFEALTTQGYDVRQAHDANQGYQLVLKQKPDLILLDIVLPDVDGVELCRAFKSHPATRDIPIILLTGTASSTPAKIKGFKAGADDYVLKPFEMEELIERVRAVLRRNEPPPVTGLKASELPAPVETSSSGLSSGAAARETSSPAEPPLPEPSPETPGWAPGLRIPSMFDALCRAFVSPSSLAKTLPEMSLMFLVALMLLVSAGLIAAPGSSLRPVSACVMGGILWGAIVSILVVACSLFGIPLKWREGGTVLSLAAAPLLLKLIGGAVFAGWTTLSPFLFTASPALFFKNVPFWLYRIDFFELWSVWLLAIFLQKRSEDARGKALAVAGTVWVLAAVMVTAFKWVGGS